VSKRPIILQIIPRLDTGGAELATVEITDAVMRAGGRMLVATEGGRMESRIAEAGGEIVRLPVASKSPLRLLTNARALARLIEERGIELVHARSRAPAWSGLWAARHTNRRFVTTYHGVYGNKEPFKDLYNGVMARGDRVIANSRFTAELIGARHGTAEAKIRIIPRGVDLVQFDPGRIAPARVETLRQQWGVAAGAPIILIAARLTDWKGQRVLLDAAGHLLATDRLGEAHIVLAGDAQGRTGYLADLTARGAELGLAGRVHLPGHCEDIAAAYAAAHVTVVASTKPEAFGRAAAEALAMGCPVIASDLGAPPETLLTPPRVPPDEVTGWLVPSSDPARLAEALALALALDPARRLQMGQRSRADMATRFSLDMMKRRTLGVYDELLDSALLRRFEAATDG